MRKRSQKVLISLPQQLLSAIDAVKTERQISRAAFVRESLVRNLHYYQKYERGWVGIQAWRMGHVDPKPSFAGRLFQPARVAKASP